jgi:predicted transposase YbfD/YdcC
VSVSTDADTNAETVYCVSVSTDADTSAETVYCVSVRTDADTNADRFSTHHVFSSLHQPCAAEVD